MKTLHKKYTIALLATALLTGACEKDLQQLNPNQQTSATFWQNQEDAIKGINATYQTLTIDGGYMRSTPLLLDTRGDDVRSNSPWDQMYNSGKFALNAGNSDIYGWAFGAYYEGVSKANQVLDFVPGIKMDEEVKKRVLGQAYFLRGLYFYHLVNMFGNVILPTTSVKSTKDFYVKQSTEAEGWAQVINDLKKASELLPVSYDNVTGPDKGQKGRATKGAALAFLGKAYLFTKKYPEAASQFKAVMDLGIYDLVAEYRDNFTEKNENNKESLFEVQFSRDAGGKDLNWGGEPQPGWGVVSARAITYAPRGFGWTDVQPTRSSFNEFLLEKTISGDDDPRLVATMFYNKPGLKLYGKLFSENYKNNPADLNDLFVRKYENDDSGRSDEFDWRSGINERIMRYADVLMMYAECLNETGQTAQAYQYIQKVRSRVNLPDLAAVRPNMTAAQMRDQLAHERLLEFSFEGHRFDDIKRWGWLSDPAKLAELKQRDPEFNTYQKGREFFPIPIAEINTNPGVKQNQSY
ncbi:Starch-binding associating with outer membrane [Pseudarcicella hirudinis]|uniref:Starch-binding associating with outer membrane n=3 Tax=Pseudarcicella hirudinis TaxID=1079859 RepID=A0A1I5TXP2_9BACT|nr:Starch-binding associating with outer membrane [Pseudarcicella hirudinis]